MSSTGRASTDLKRSRLPPPVLKPTGVKLHDATFFPTPRSCFYLCLRTSYPLTASVGHFSGAKPPLRPSVNAAVAIATRISLSMCSLLESKCQVCPKDMCLTLVRVHVHEQEHWAYGSSSSKMRRSRVGCILIKCAP